MLAVFDGLVCCCGFCGIGLCSAVLAQPLNNGTLEVELYAVVFEQVAGKRRSHAAAKHPLPSPTRFPAASNIPTPDRPHGCRRT